MSELNPDGPLYPATTAAGFMRCPPDSFEVGNDVSIPVQFNDSGLSPIDPTTVTLRVFNPDSTTDVFTYPGMGTPITKNGTGNYSYTKNATESGNVFFRWEGSGNLVSAVEGQFTINPSNVISA